MITNKLKDIQYRFKDYIISEKNHSGNTVEAYYNDVVQFIEYLTLLDKKNSIDNYINIENLDNYIIWLHTNNISAKSIVRKLSSLSVFLKFLKIEGFIKDNPSYLLNRPKVDKKLPNYLSTTEIEKFINAIDNNKPFGLRDRALFELIYSCGLRVSEVSSLDVGSIYFEESIIKIFGKGSKERFVPLGERAKNEINNYLNKGRSFFVKNNKKSNSLFLNYRGDRLTRKGIWKNLKAIAEKASLDSNKITVHTLRHSFATHLIQNGADIRSVQELLGHKNIITTEIYTHLNLENLRQNYNKYHTLG